MDRFAALTDFKIMDRKLRFYTTDSNHYWKQCKYCGAFCQLIIDGKPTNKEIRHHGDCAVLELETLIEKLKAEGFHFILDS